MRPLIQFGDASKRRPRQLDVLLRHSRCSISRAAAAMDAAHPVGQACETGAYSRRDTRSPAIQRLWRENQLPKLLWEACFDEVPRLGLAAQDRGVRILWEQVEVGLVGGPGTAVDRRVGGQVPGHELIVSGHPLEHIGPRCPRSGVSLGRAPGQLCRRPHRHPVSS